MIWHYIRIRESRWQRRLKRKGIWSTRESFAGSMAESQMLSGCHFFKVYVDGELEYVLLTKSSAEDAYMVGRLAVCQIRTLVSAYMEQFDRNNFMQKYPARQYAWM